MWNNDDSVVRYYFSPLSRALREGDRKARHVLRPNIRSTIIRNEMTGMKRII